MTIQVTYSDFTVATYTSFEEAEEAILANHAEGIGVDRVVEIDRDGNEGQEYGCSWDVSLEELN